MIRFHMHRNSTSQGSYVRMDLFIERKDKTKSFKEVTFLRDSNLRLKSRTQGRCLGILYSVKGECCLRMAIQKSQVLDKEQSGGSEY